MKILFISHTFPPIFGGVEKQNYYISESLKKDAEVKVLANSKGKWWLPIFIPVTFLRVLYLMSSFDVCLMGNGVLAPIGAVLKFFYPRKKFICIVHGLDITFADKKGFLSTVYRIVNIPSLKKVDKLFMVGNHTIDEAVKIGIARNHCVFIPNGIVMKDLIIDSSRNDMAKVLGTDVADKKIILRIARFVPHKGVEWFIRNVMPKLPENFFFVAVGGLVSSKSTGNENIYPLCEKAIKEFGLEKRVKLIPNIPEKDKLVLLNTADLYISPNINIPGSMEGFGITAIEGGACGRVVLASNMEGLKDAIHEGKNGFLIEPENAQAWADKIIEVASDDSFIQDFGAKARQYTEENFTWEKIAKRYIEEINKLSNHLKK